MTRVEPNTGLCDRCGGLVIDALPAAATQGARMRFDAAPDATAEHTVWNRGDVWLWRPSSTDPAGFWGMRRREHVCRIPDQQLELSTEGRLRPDHVPCQEVATCPSASSPTDSVAPSSSSSSP